MATTLKSQLVFITVAAGGTATLPHNLNFNGTLLAPDCVSFENPVFNFVSSTSTTITVINTGLVPASCRVLCELWHTYERAFGDVAITALPGKPFINRGVNLGGGGTIAGPGDSQCLIYQPGGPGPAAGPGTFTDWASLMAQLAAYRSTASGGGCYTIQFDDSFVSPAVIPAGGPYLMDNVVWEGRDGGFGAFVSIANGVTFTGLRSFRGAINVTNSNLVTPAVADLVDGDIITIEGNSTLDTVLGGASFFSGAGLAPGNTVIVLLREASSAGFTTAGPFITFPVAGSFLLVGLEGLAAVQQSVLVGALGTFLQVAVSTMMTVVTSFPNWAGTVLDPRLDDPASVLPQPFLTAPAVAPFTAFPSQWLRFNSTGITIAQTLPSINAAFNDQSSPGEFLIITDYGTGVLTISPAVGDTINGAAGPFNVPAGGGALILISDGVSDWRTIAIFGNDRFSPPEQWAQQNVAASQAAVALSAQVSTNFDTIKMMRSGSVVGLSTRLTEAVTAGTATVRLTINGAAGTLNVVHTAGSNPTGGQSTQRAGIDRFVAGGLIGLSITTDAGFLPITTDLEAWLEIEELP